jgi:hypothetical protein
MVAHGALGYEELPCDGGDSLALGKPTEDLRLAAAQAPQSWVGPPTFAGSSKVANARGLDLGGDSPQVTLQP